MTLGQALKAGRAGVGFTLREVEALTGISNGYLSQLESDAIRQPSPNHLNQLAETYKLDYSLLMKLAGYAVARQVGAALGLGSSLSFPGVDDLTEEDRRKIQAYIDDLRDARRLREAAAAKRA